MVKCAICERRPANGGGYCAQCASKLEAESKRQANDMPQKFLTYRGHVIGLFPNGNGELIAKLLQRNPETLPKGKTLDLNHYCEGYTREVIKRFKACVLQLGNA